MSDINLLEQLLACNKVLFESGHYEASYHLLCAAKHYASDMGDTPSLNALLALAHEQSDWINVHTPDSILAQQSSLARNKVNLYTSLFEQLRGKIQIAEANRIMHNLSH